MIAKFVDHLLLLRQEKILRQSGFAVPRSTLVSFAFGVTEIGCMNRVCRKFYELHITKERVLAEQALRNIVAVCEIELEVHDVKPDAQLQIR